MIYNRLRAGSNSGPFSFPHFNYFGKEHHIYKVETRNIFMNNYRYFIPDWRVFISLRENQGVPIEKLRQQFLQEMNNYYGREMFLMNMAAVAGSGAGLSTPVSTVAPITKLTSGFSGITYARLDGQSNAAAQFSDADEVTAWTGSGFVQVSQSSADVEYIRGGTTAVGGYEDGAISSHTTVLGGVTLADGDTLTLDGSNGISWYSIQRVSLQGKLNQLILDNTSTSKVYAHIGAKGGTGVGDHIASNDYDPTHAGSVAKGGHLRIKDRAWAYWYQRYGPNGGNASLEGTDPADYKVFIYWQGENEFLRVARNQSTLEYANNARDALHAKFESLGYYDYYDAIIEVQPVYFAGFADTTDLETWSSSYASVISSYKAKAEAKPKTAWISIDDMLQAPTSASYKLEAAVPGGSVANKYLHMNPVAHYEIAQRIWNQIYEA